MSTPFDSAKRDVRDRLPISEVVGEYVRLQRAGAGGRWKGLCPFHEEKTPSFTVSDEKGFYYCFGCQAHGDVFSFWMRQESASFPEALRALAERAGVALPAFNPERRAAQASKEDALFGVAEAAAAFYHGLLFKGAEGEPGRAYLKARGVSQEMAKRFRLGFAPESWDALKGHLAARGASISPAVEAGLLVEREGKAGHYDRFRSRLIFPVLTPGGRVAGLGGRIVGDGEPKYLNSPESPIYTKSRVLYGLDQARDAIRREGRALIVEGYMDLIALVQYGVENVVATCGTALTRGHLAVLRRLGAEATLLFDGDAAGRRAARRALDLALAEGVPVRVLRLPEEHDPDTYVRAEGADALLAALEGAPELFERVLEDLAAETAGMSVEARLHKAGELVDALRGAADPLVRAAHAERLASRIGVPAQAVVEAMAKGPAAPAERRPAAEAPAAPARRVNRNEALLTSLLLAHPALVDGPALREAIAEFEDEDLAAVAEAALALRDAGEPPTVAAICDRLEERERARRLASRLGMEDGPPVDAEEEREATVRRMFADLLGHVGGRGQRRRERELKDAMRAAWERRDLEEWRRLERLWRAEVARSKAPRAAPPARAAAAPTAPGPRPGSEERYEDSESYGDADFDH